MYRGPLKVERRGERMNDTETYAELNTATGEIEVRDLYTGEIVNALTYSQRVYTIEMGDAICNALRQGKTLNNISKIVGMPPLFVMYNWKNGNPEFKLKIKQAKMDRAEYFHDRAADLLEDAENLDKDSVPANKLAIDGFIKLAEKGNPDEYNPKPTLLQNGAAPTMIVINTGISREPITVEIKDEKICIGEQPENRVGAVSEDGASSIEVGREASGDQASDGDSSGS